MRARIAVLPGDGVGPEVTREAVRVLNAVAERWDHGFEFTTHSIGGIAIDETGEPLPQSTIAACIDADAVLLGAVGGPKWDDPNASVRPEQGLLELRSQLGVFANVRPVAVHAAGARVSPVRPERLAGVDIVFVRELTGGIYFGEKRRFGAAGAESASDVCTYTTREIERVTRVAARIAMDRRWRLTSIDKANVLETSRLWRSVVTRIVHSEFPHLGLDHMLVDSAAMQLLQRPADFDVLLTENMFGDILTDEAAVLAGSIGLLPSASLGDGAGLYEPVHGSAPQLAGRNEANPVGAILSAALLLGHSLGLHDEASAVVNAVDHALDREFVTADLAVDASRAMRTDEVGAVIVNNVLTLEPSHV